MKNAIWITVAAALLLLLLGGLWIFVIGEPVDGNTISCEVEELENQINIYVSMPNSALAFGETQFRQVDNVLTITMRKVLVSPLYSSGTKMIWLEKGTETEIWLGGKCIWKAEP